LYINLYIYNCGYKIPHSGHETPPLTAMMWYNTRMF